MVHYCVQLLLLLLQFASLTTLYMIKSARRQADNQKWAPREHETATAAAAVVVEMADMPEEHQQSQCWCCWSPMVCTMQQQQKIKAKDNTAPFFCSFIFDNVIESKKRRRREIVCEAAFIYRTALLMNFD